MPYAVKQLPSGDWVKVKRSHADTIISRHKTKAEAIAAIRAYYANKRSLENRSK
jgi:hypothetical protein